MIEILLLLGTLAVVAYYVVVWWTARASSRKVRDMPVFGASDVLFEAWVSDQVKREMEQDWRDPRGYL